FQDFLSRPGAARYPQGRIFFLGALEQFEKKGLVVLEEKASVKKETPPAQLAPEKKSVAQVAPPAVSAPVKEKKIVVKDPPKAASPFRPGKSAFLEAVEYLKKTGIEYVAVDMLKFRY